MPVLFKYPCGCIGLPPHQYFDKHEGQFTDESVMSFVLIACDDEHEYYFREREVSLVQGRKESTPLPLEECQRILNRVNAALANGYRFRELRNILGIKQEEP